ncbi:SDR family oxidoreductase [uncultured Sphingomonas sp.]|jgi:NAD(P)-dependent dehydrogenase (short-subunit alcohol dehydrogenase family)|uniref:SDR family oxidoreductase n=1 Tax=unclassified Sphingomonas TaxID=196159 RepID=UPI0025EC4EB4|nr:SDR family oxidoreductase [uncultured Sphingomonas sp.]
MTDRSDAHTAITPLAGRRVLVTGGTTGIGRAIAVLLASEGARVFVCGRNEQHLEDALTRIREVGEGDGIAIDLAEEENVARLFEAATGYLGGLDVAVINAARGAEGLLDMTEADLRYTIGSNFTAYLLSAQHAAKAMGADGEEAKAKAKGDIVLIGSMSAYVLGPGSTVYAGIKYGIQGFAIALRRELGPKGVRVSLVEPGLTGSDMVEGTSEEQAERINKEEMLRAEDIAVGVHYLLTQPSRTVVQQVTISPRMQDQE